MGPITVVRNTKLELWFVKALKSKADLRSYRDAAITAGINDARGAEVRSWLRRCTRGDI